ncbi:MAG: S41 family peptidase [Acidobacteriota bacterium]
MKLFLCFLCVVSGICSVAVIGQSPSSPMRSGLIGSEPFSIHSGSSFDASSPSSNDINRGGSAADRNRVLDNIREAESIISNNHIDGSLIEAPAMTKAALSSMLHTLDPHSNFFDSGEWRALLDEQKSGYAGVGMSFAEFTRSGETNTFILSTFPSTSARRADLRFGDRIVAVNGISVVGKPSDSVSRMVRGAVGTKVRLDIERADSLRIESIELTRKMISQPSIPDFYILRPGVGYIDLSEGFNYTTSDELTAAMRQLHRNGMTSLVLDLRGNGGGIVDQAVKVVETFLPAGSLIVSQRGRSVEDTREWRSSNPAPETMPLVVLVDENTASASEIVAGALQDSDRALIVGERTFGKGLVQSVIDLPGSTGLTLTAARYFTPTGRSIQRDYSQIGRYEYFNHRDEAAAIDKPYFESRTITNRKLLGGDGIAPDLELRTEGMSESQIRILDPLLFFARDLVNHRVPGFENYAVRNIASANDQVPARANEIPSLMMAKFEEFAATSNFAVTSQLVAHEREFNRDRLRYLLTCSASGSTLAKREQIASDRVVSAAIQTIPRAKELWDLATRLNRSAWK